MPTVVVFVVWRRLLLELLCLLTATGYLTSKT